MTSFAELGLHAPILKVLAAGSYDSPTPIQAQAIPHVLAGRDILGIAQTGTGKTAAFALPILHRLAGDLASGNRKRAPGRACRALILSPTRELASQIEERFRFYGRHLGLSATVVFGGVGGGPQIRTMAKGIDVLIATPGRLLDHMSAGFIRLDHVETVVLDEADQMLDLGFVVPIRRIIAALPARRQSLFFSATMPKEIARLASSFLKDSVTVAITPVATTVERVEQRVIMIDAERKRAMLSEILHDPAFTRTLVFTRTKHGADRVARHLETGRISAAAIHGNKSQGQRERALADFRKGQVRVLVATDIAARGIDVEAVSHVINFDMPNVAETYVHRIGRTARAGAAGIAISLCSHDERGQLRDIERLIRQPIPMTDRRGLSAQLGEGAIVDDNVGRPGKHGEGHRHRHGRRGSSRGDNGQRQSHGHERPQDAQKQGQPRHEAPRQPHKPRPQDQQPRGGSNHRPAGLNMVRRPRPGLQHGT
ncbi:MAG: DEAD/DEAH box helicase [Alphaproteobacteria bacterium]|nr:DEAD/DEAH box helicase [Alphaproteobacteria bacterium]